MTKVGNKKTLKGKELIAGAKSALENEKQLSPEFKNAFSALIDFSSALLDHLGINSSNSSMPPSKDSNRKRRELKSKGTKRKPGGQNGHAGNSLTPMVDPHEVVKIEIDRSSLPTGKYSFAGIEKRQVFNVEVSLHVTEYQAEVLINQKGEEFVADFPEGINQPAQYGSSVKATSVYLSQAQLIPLDRVRDCFQDHFNLPVSKGSIFNFNRVAFHKLDYFEDWAKLQLLISPSMNADETGINIGGTGHWLHCFQPN